MLKINHIKFDTVFKKFSENTITVFIIVTRDECDKPIISYLKERHLIKEDHESFDIVHDDVCISVDFPDIESAREFLYQFTDEFALAHNVYATLWEHGEWEGEENC